MALSLGNRDRKKRCERFRHRPAQPALYAAFHRMYPPGNGNGERSPDLNRQGSFDKSAGATFFFLIIYNRVSLLSSRLLRADSGSRLRKTARPVRKGEKSLRETLNPLKTLETAKSGSF